MPGIVHVLDPYHGVERGWDSTDAALRYLEEVIQLEGPQTISAFILETVSGTNGILVPPDGYLQGVRALCDRHGILMIADEVMTGFGRTGAWFASEHEGIVPDLVVAAKGIAGGLPLSAVTGRAEIMDSAMAGGLGGTYAGSPIACAAALATIETYEHDGLIERAKEIGAVLIGRLNALRTADARIGDVRGRGAMVAIELVDPETGAPDAALTNAVAKHAHANGVVLLTCGTYGNVIRFLPPLTISDELLIEGLGVIAEGLKTA